MADRSGSLTKSGSGSYLIIQDGRMDDLGESNEVFTSHV